MNETLTHNEKNWSVNQYNEKKWSVLFDFCRGFNDNSFINIEYIKYYLSTTLFPSVSETWSKVPTHSLVIILFKLRTHHSVWKWNASSSRASNVKHHSASINNLDVASQISSQSIARFHADKKYYVGGCVARVVGK